MRWARWVAVWAGAMGAIAAPRAAHAAELVARGPAECADTAEITFRIERNIAMPLRAAAPLQFDVVMERDGAAYRARIAVQGGPSSHVERQRQLVAADCGRLVDALVVAVALALGVADGSGEKPADAPVAGASPEPNAAPVPTAAGDAGAAGQPPSSDAAWRPSLSLWLVGDAGSLAQPDVGAALGAEVGYGNFELHLLATLLFEQQTRLAPTPLAAAPGAKLDLFTGALLGCTSPLGRAHSSIVPLVCLGAELGRLAGTGTGVTAPRQGSASWLAPVVQVGGFWQIPGTLLRLGLSVLGAAPLRRDAFTLRDIGTVHQPPSVVGRLCLGFDVAFD